MHSGIGGRSLSVLGKGSHAGIGLWAASRPTYLIRSPRLSSKGSSLADKFRNTTKQLCSQEFFSQCFLLHVRCLFAYYPCAVDGQIVTAHHVPDSRDCMPDQELNFVDLPPRNSRDFGKLCPYVHFWSFCKTLQPSSPGSVLLICLGCYAESVLQIQSQKNPFVRVQTLRVTVEFDKPA